MKFGDKRLVLVLWLILVGLITARQVQQQSTTGTNASANLSEPAGQTARATASGSSIAGWPCPNAYVAAGVAYMVLALLAEFSAAFAVASAIGLDLAMVLTFKGFSFPALPGLKGPSAGQAISGTTSSSSSTGSS